MFDSSEAMLELGSCWFGGVDGVGMELGLVMNERDMMGRSTIITNINRKLVRSCLVSQWIDGWMRKVP